MSDPASPTGALSVGMGFDAHRFSDGGAGARPLWLACISWPGDGLQGDSDGDVAVHAIIDALLAAGHLGDIGTLFGIGKDSRGAGGHGESMLRETVEFLREHRCTPNSVSVVVIGNRPRLAPRAREAEGVMSRAVGCSVSLGATTTDHMGFTGHGEGLAAMATALVRIGARG